MRFLPLIVILASPCMTDFVDSPAPDDIRTLKAGFDNDTVATMQDYILLKIPVSSFTSDLSLHSRRRSKRFIGNILSGVSAFVVKSGIWSAFKFSCLEFLKYTGGAIIGEIL